MNNEIDDIQLKKELEEDERIIKFLRGDMTTSEESAFLEELKMNDDLRERAIIQARMIKGMKEIDDEIAELMEDSQPNNRTIPLLAKRWLAVAASVILIAVVGVKSYDYFNTISLGKEYANAFPAATVLRGETDKDVEAELTALFDKVSNGEDLSDAISRLSILWKQAKQDTYNAYTNYAPYIGWYLAIGYLEDYEKVKAKSILNEMAAMYPEGTAVGDKVLEIIDLL